MIHSEIDVKLVFHEILWKKNFTVYPSLKNLKNNDKYILTFTNKVPH